MRLTGDDVVREIDLHARDITGVARERRRRLILRVSLATALATTTLIWLLL